MPSILLSDNGVSSGSAGLKSTAANDGALVLQTTTAGGTATTALTISNTQVVSLANPMSLANGSAAAPAITGTDTDTGIFFPAANTLAFSTNGTEDARFDASGNLGIGTTSPSSGPGFIRVAELYHSNNCSYAINANGTARADFGISSSGGWLGTHTSHDLRFVTASTERARIDTSGNLLVGAALTLGSTAGILVAASGANVQTLTTNSTSNSAYYIGRFYSGGTERGYIYYNGSTVAFTSTSDYRLKEDVLPMTGALAKVAQLKPCTYTWKENGQAGQGFIAHELAEVVPDCVSGEKDAVDEDGTPRYQGIDTSFLVATLTAAIQELKAIVDAQAAEIAALKGTQQ